MSKLLHFWCFLFLPYQNLAYFRTLLDFFADLTLYSSVTAQRKVYLLFTIWAVFCLHSAYLWAFLPPPLDRLRQGDFVSLVIQKDTFYLAWATFGLLMIYFIHVLCFTMKPAFLRLSEDILFQDGSGVLQGVGYGTVSEQTTARFICLGLVNLLQVFVLVSDTVILLLINSLFTIVIENPGEFFGSPLDTPFTFSWNVFRFILGTWMTATCFGLYTKILINGAALGAGHLCLLFRRLYHSETLLVVYSPKTSIFSWAPFRQYLAYSGQTFGMIFTTNHINGRLFLAFLLVNMPISAWAIVQLALGKLSQQARVTLTNLACQELLGCILLHWVLAKFTKRLHAPSKTLLSWNVATSHRVGNFRARLLLHHTIVRLHTKAKYGYTYGSVGGLITMGSFAKCMLQFTELLMYAYTLIRGI